MNQIGKNIKRARSNQNITQDQLAEPLNVTRQAVSNWEIGKTQPDIETLTKIAEHLTVSTEFLIYGKEITKESDVKTYTWNWGKQHLSVTYYPERMVMLGVALAITVSYVNWHSIGWALLHGILNWGYILYYIIRY